MHWVTGVWIFGMLAGLLSGAGTLSLQPSAATQAVKLAGDPKTSRIDSMLVSVDGKLELEWYGKNNSSNLAHDLRSATKSITGLLVGIAVDRGFIAPVDQSAVHWFPELLKNKSQAHFSNITVRHLLEMTGGLDADDWDPKSPGNEERMYPSPDWLKFFFSLPKKHDPGNHFQYCTAGVVVLGEIVARASGQKLDSFAHENLFEPLGIESAVWARAPKGLIDAGGHLKLTSRDFLKIGILMLHEGRHRDRQIISTNWIRHSLSPAQKIPGGAETGPYFGRLWWLEPVVEEKSKSFQARGNGGQFLIMVPEKKLVAAFTGSGYNDSRQGLPFRIMKECLIPGVR